MSRLRPFVAPSEADIESSCSTEEQFELCWEAYLIVNEDHLSQLQELIDSIIAELSSVKLHPLDFAKAETYTKSVTIATLRLHGQLDLDDNEKRELRKFFFKMGASEGQGEHSVPS